MADVCLETDRFHVMIDEIDFTQLFPNWRGTFDGSRPSLAGLEGTRIANALERGLLTEGEVSGLLHLIREPDVRTQWISPMNMSLIHCIVSLPQSSFFALPFPGQHAQEVPY